MFICMDWIYSGSQTLYIIIELVVDYASKYSFCRKFEVYVICFFKQRTKMDMIYCVIFTVFIYLTFQIKQLRKENILHKQKIDMNLEAMEYSFKTSLEHINKYIMDTIPKDEYTTQKNFTKEIFNLNDRFVMIQRDLETFKQNQITYNNELEELIYQGFPHQCVRGVLSKSQQRRASLVKSEEAVARAAWMHCMDPPFKSSRK